MSVLAPLTVPLPMSDTVTIQRLFLAPLEAEVLSLVACILVVEDDDLLAQSVIHLLTEEGREFRHASRVADAIEALKHQPFELVLLDFRLSDGTGLQVLDWLRENGRSEAVIIVSGEGSIQAAIGGLRGGACDYLQKPYLPAQLRQAVNNALGRQALARSHEAMRQQLEHSDRMHRYVVEHSPDLIYTLDPEGCFSYLNQRVESLLGYQRESLIGEHYSMLLWHAEGSLTDDDFRMLERRTGHRATYNVELRLRRSQAEIPLDEHFSSAYVTVMLNATGMYVQDKDKLEPRFLGTYGVARDITDRKRAEEIISYQAYHDQLTQLPNRALFLDRLEMSINQAQRREALLAVMFIDLDRFKVVNDSFGHAEGDRLLREFSERVKGCLRKGDTLARLGGDEFTVLLTDLTEIGDASIIKDKIFEALRTPFRIGGADLRATCSLGIAIYPRDGADAEDLIRHADMAMYAVKSHGKNHHAFFEQAMDTAQAQKLALERELMQAVENRELFLEYQPKYSYESKSIVGVEALLRWQHAALGRIMPADFIPIAEESGFITSLSDWVLEEACRQLSIWQRTYPALQLSLNMSPQDFERDDIVSRICQAIARHDIHSGTLEIEITETSLLRNAEKVSGMIRSLREQGVRVSIDDFGTGYSSLAYLLKLPVSSLKIDKRFVQELGGEPAHHPIVSAIAGVARGFGLHIVAEGVETMQQAKALQSAGCDEMQGFYFSRPLSWDQLTRKLATLQ